MAGIRYRDRRAVQLESETLRLTVLVEGGHIAELLHKASGVNPLWTPPWPSIEPSTYVPARHPAYGSGAESQLLAGIMGHNLCLDLFGGPSDEEAAAGMTVHGEASIAPYSIDIANDKLVASTNLQHAQLRFERTLRLDPDGRTVHFAETVENLSAFDRPIAWTQHVTLGPPFLEHGTTQFRTPGTRSRVFEADFGDGGRMRAGADFDWPNVPLTAGGTDDLRAYTKADSSSGYTAHLMDPHRDRAFFTAWSPRTKVLIGYTWKRSDFPWLGIWEENRSRAQAPWNGKTVTRGMEFGASPIPESRRTMIERGSLFGVPGYRWLPARTRARVEYTAFITTAEKIPDEV